MKTEIITDIKEFEATINTVTFNDENTYYVTLDTLNTINDLFGEIYTDELIADLASRISDYLDMYDDYPYNELLSDLQYDINKAKTFDTIEFSEAEFYWLNEYIASNHYIK